MRSRATNIVRAGSRIAILLSVFALLPLAATPAWAIDCVAEAGGVIDGFVNYPVPPSQIQIDGPCTIRNYPASNPLTSNISWFGSLPTSTLLIFDNVVHTGNMACNLPVSGQQDLVRQQLVQLGPAALPEPSDPGREDRQAERSC